MEIETETMSTFMQTLETNNFGIVCMNTYTQYETMHFFITVGEKGNEGLMLKREGRVEDFEKHLKDIVSAIARYKKIS